jgi:dienelactone hydrolase
MKINVPWASRSLTFHPNQRLRWLVGSAMMLLASLGHAQATLFEETFDSGAGQFATQGSVYASDGNVRLRGGSSSGVIVSSTIDATGYTDISLSFDRSTSGLDYGESGRALVSINGGSFTLVESTRSASGRTTLALGSSADNATIQLAFSINASSFYEVYTVDNVVLEGSSDSEPPPPPPGENSASGFFLETGSSATTPDQFSFTNTGEVAISRLVIDLSNGSGTPVFDPVDVPFSVTSTDNVGFSGNFALNGAVLTLDFSGFDPGETFSLNGDLDDANGGFTTGAEVAGSVLTSIAAGSEDAVGTFIADSADANRANVVAGDGDQPPPPPPGCASGDPTVAILEADRGPCTYRTMSVSSSVSGFGGGTIHYPTEGGPYGVIAVVPGFVSPESSIQWWGPRLSSHGFVVITIDTNSGFDDPASRAVQLRNALDYTISQSNSSSSPISGLVDSSKQGVMGWSMGGGGSLIMAADDPTLKAAIPQAPWHSGSNDFEDIVVPTLILACESDSTAPVSQHASPFYNTIPSSTDKAYLEINNGSHSCANSGNSNADLIGKYGVAWMKRFMDDDTRYSPFLCGAPHQADLSGFTISEYRETCPY